MKRSGFGNIALITALSFFMLSFSTAASAQDPNSSPSQSSDMSKQSDKNKDKDKDKKKDKNKDKHNHSDMDSGGTDSASMLSSDDKRFVMETAHGGMMEIEMAKTALERSSSDNVKQYAQRMIDDHTRANDELMQLASTKGITIPSSMHHEMGSQGGSGSQATSGAMASDSDMDKMHRKTMASMDKMRKYSGAEFDSHYLRDQVKMHAKMADMFQREASRGKDTDLRGWASKTLPTVQEHLQMARDLSATMGGKKMDDKKMDDKKMDDKKKDDKKSSGTNR